MSLNLFKSTLGLEICTHFKPAIEPDSQNILVYLNGLTQTISSWGGQSQFFAPYAHQLFLDFPGQGRSSKLRQPMSLQQQGELLHELLTATLEQNFALQSPLKKSLFFMGFSFGSRVLLEYLWQQKTYKQANLAGLIIVGSSYIYTKEQVITFSRWRNLLDVRPPLNEVDTMKIFFQQILPDIIGANYLQKNMRLLKFMESAFLQRNDLQSLCYLLESITHTTAKEPGKLLEPINLPALLVRGQQDSLCLTENLLSLQKFFPNSKIIEIPEAAHTVAIEKPIEFNQAVLKYIHERA